MTDNAERSPEMSVPLSVLDKFLKLSQENHEAYSAMVSAVDSMSSKMLDLTDQMAEVKDTIDKEQLAKVVIESMQDMRADLAILKTVRDEFGALKLKQDALPDLLREVAACNGKPQYNVLATLAASLEFEQWDKKEVQELAGAMETLLSIVVYLKARQKLFIFLAGILVVMLLGTAGEGAKTVIKFIMSVI